MYLVKDDTLHSLKKICILSENIIFYEQIRTPQAATLPVVPFGTQSSSKFLHHYFWAQNSLVENPKLNPNNHYSSGTLVFVTG